jgi:hypothetical protein
MKTPRPLTAVGRYVSFIGDGPGKDDVSDTGQGKKAVIFRLDPDAYHQLKQIADRI